jgi:DNA mismatch repair protein MutL
VTDADELVELDEDAVERIAAGEVVERPASVVKELVENSLDAGASRVDVAVERGGKDLVRVRDDGEGMTEAAVRTAVRSHTTSKIRDAADLDAGVDTLGFRGEALSTIGAVAKLTVRTKPPGPGAGTELRLAGGEVVAVEPTGCPAGTTVAVTDLFYNTPAREKYLKQDRTEFGRVNDVVTKYALARPGVAVSLTHDGREVFATTGQGDRRAAVLSVYGREVADAMVPVDAGEAAPPGDVEGPLDAVEGYVSDPETTRSSREYVAAFVNGRYVQSTAAREAVVDAYGGQLAADRYPFAVLDLRVPPGQVDVNVHPRKLEVRFADEDAVREQVETAVREALLDAGLVRSSAPRGRSAPEEATVEPTWPDDGDDGPADRDGDGVDRTGDERGVDRTGDERGVDRTAANAGADDGAGVGNDATGSHGGSSGDGSGHDGSTGGTAPGASQRNGEERSTTVGRDRGRPTATEQRTLDGEAASRRREYDALPSLRVLGQYDDTYVVAETDDGLVLVDQHAADERVNYERLRERFADGATSQALAEPVELELTAGEAELFERYREAMARLGFHAGLVDDRTVEVRTVPAVVSDALEPALLRDVLSRTMADGAADAPVEARADDLLADLACYPSITGNTSLSEGSVLDLLSALDDCENPYACPHGRPVLVHLDDDELDERFERDYPGHAGRRE